MRWPSLAFWCLRTTAGTKMTISSTINSHEYFYRDPARVLLGFVHHGYFWFSAPAKQCQNYLKWVPRGFLLFCICYNFWTELSVPYLGYFPSFNLLLMLGAARVFCCFVLTLNCFYDWVFFIEIIVNFECVQTARLQQSDGWHWLLWRP